MATASAVTPSYSMPGVLMGENFADLLNVQFKEITKRACAKPRQGLRYFTEETTGRSYEKYSSITGLTVVPESRDVNDIPLDSPIQGPDVTLTPSTYRRMIQIERRLRETDQYGKINTQITGLAESAGVTVEMYCANAFNTGFDSTAAWLCADGMYLFDSARPSEDKGVAAWSNLETAGTLTRTSLASMRVNFRKVVNERGLVSPIVMRKLIVPPDLQDTAEELMTSPYKVGVSLNDKNVYEGRFDVEVWDYLTSTTAWFGMGDPNSPLHELKYLWGARPSTESGTLSGSGNPDVWWARVRFVFTTGCVRPTNLRGNAGA